MSKKSQIGSFSRSQKEIAIVGAGAILATIIVIVILILTIGSTKISLISDGVEIRELKMSKQFEGVEDPIKAGYSFEGWYYNAEGLGEEVEKLPRLSRETISVYAKWAPKTYTITFDKQGGDQGTDSIDAIFDQTVPQIEIPTKDKYVFAGYYTEMGGAGKQYFDNLGLPYVNPEDTSGKQAI